MKAIEIKPGVYWVGARDWKLRDFHGYKTGRGSTYNAYLIIDEKVTLVDSVKAPFCGEMLERIRSVVDPAKISLVVCNHVEMDHSGSIPEVAALSGATVLASPAGGKGLAAHFAGRPISVRAVASGEKISIGRRSLVFAHTPMVHWPDSMVTYVPEDELLLPNDAFGQHLCSGSLFDDENPADIVFEEAAKYYANIVMPYGPQVEKALAALSSLRIGMIGPSHGVVWRSRIPGILERYSKWAAQVPENRALVVYDTMWGSTEKMAHAIKSAFEEKNIPAVLCSLQHTHYSDAMAEVLSSRHIAIGSPTLNGEMLPSVAAFLTYMKGLKPKGKTGLAFGSFGWASKSAGQIEEVMRGLRWEMPLEAQSVQWIPSAGYLAGLKESVEKSL